MIDKISIVGLWGERNYRIKFVDGSLIIVGENGSGKTTVLRIIYNVLSRNWSQLFEEDFDKIELYSEDNNSITINSKYAQELEDYYVNIRGDFDETLPLNVIKDLLNYCGEMTTPEKVLEACQANRIPDVLLSVVLRVVNQKNKRMPKELQEINDWIKVHNDYPIIYLPTYRRSERYQQNQGYIDSRIRRHRGYDNLIFDIEVAKEGMKDIDETIKTKILEIKNEYAKSSSELNAKCFKGILTREYVRVRTPEEIICSDSIQKEYYENLDSIAMIFSSINGTEFLENTEQIKKQLLQVLEKNGHYDDYDKIVVYYYQMLLERYEHLKNTEEPLEAFFYACNKYLSNKRIQYSPNDFKYEIVLEQSGEEHKRVIDLNHLSSGEKQLVSLFCYIYLSNPDKCMVIIDEPELSLSVEWQKSILEDVAQSGKCGSLIVATQSPFVYDNSLRPLAKSLDTFLTME